MQAMLDSEILSEKEYQDKHGTDTPDRPIPELLQTIDHQMNWLRSEKRAVVYLPTGSIFPPLPNGIKFLKTDKGYFYYNPKMINANEIWSAVLNNEIGYILGYGIARKPKLSETIGAVVIRDRNGIEKQAVAVDNYHLKQVLHAAWKMADPFDTIELEKTDKVIEDRMKG